MRRKTIAFDFDGVIHRYRHGWQDGSIYDELDGDVLELMCELVKVGYNVFIMSTRPKRQILKHLKNLFYIDHDLPCDKWFVNVGHGRSYSQAFHAMPFWEKFFKYRGGSIGICNHKAIFDALIDDRAITFSGKTDGLVDEIKELLESKERVK